MLKLSFFLFCIPCLLLAGCGLPVESGPRPLPTGSAAPTASPQEPGEPTPSQESVTLWFVREGMLVPALRTASPPVTPQDLIDLLDAHFPIDLTGRAFGVLKVKGLPIDVALPRREFKVGQGQARRSC